MKRIGLLQDARYQRHAPGPSHIESPERLSAIDMAIDDHFKDDDFIPLTPRPATFEELSWNHHPDYIKTIEATADIKQYMSLDPDTVTCPESFEVARLAAGGVFSVIDAIAQGELDGAFCLVRPPGHHAEPDRAMGFCLFNNVALGAHYSMKVHGLKRCLIVDFDLHHGNGTQKSFYRNPDILYFSTHQYPYYPGTGGADEVGAGSGEGFTVNCPLHAGCTDEDYAVIFREILIPIAREFAPEIVIVSAGFDIWWQDPLGGMKVTEKGISAMARALIDIALDVAMGKIVFVLEGGYSKEGLGRGVVTILEQLLEKERDQQSIDSAREFLKNSSPLTAARAIKKVLDTQSAYWNGLRL